MTTTIQTVLALVALLYIVVGLALLVVLPHWLRARRLGAQLTFVKLSALMLRRTPVREFSELYAGLLEAKLIDPWSPESRDVHPLELVSLGGGDMVAAAQDWKDRCERDDLSISFEQLCRTHSVGSHALESYGAAAVLNTERPRGEHWQVSGGETPRDFDQLRSWLDEERIPYCSCVYSPAEGSWVPLVEIEELYRIMRWKRTIKAGKMPNRAPRSALAAQSSRAG